MFGYTVLVFLVFTASDTDFELEPGTETLNVVVTVNEPPEELFDSILRQVGCLCADLRRVCLALIQAWMLV